MNILFFDMGSYTYRDILSYFQKMGHTYKPVLYYFTDLFEDQYFCDTFTKELDSAKYDLVFSVNFFPLVAEICHQKHIKYASWVYDSPVNNDFFPYFAYETNYIFLFDRMEAINYQKKGASRVFHLPLATNAERTDTLIRASHHSPDYTADVSFIGQLYNSNLVSILPFLPQYTQGYIEGIIQAQMRIYGYNLLDELFLDEIADNFNKSRQTLYPEAPFVTKCSLIHELHRHITNFERTFLLEELGAHFKTCFYSQNPYDFSSPVINLPAVDYYKEMPLIFHTSKLNLCPTLRSIQSGIPLRALDIMGSGGTLFSNFQPELAEFFENERDVIMYESMEDAMEKAFFYLQHDALREQIAQNGYQKTKELFNYPRQLTMLFETISTT